MNDGYAWTKSLAAHFFLSFFNSNFPREDNRLWFSLFFVYSAIKRKLSNQEIVVLGQGIMTLLKI